MRNRESREKNGKRYDVLNNCDFFANVLYIYYIYVRYIYKYELISTHNVNDVSVSLCLYGLG